MQKLIGNLRLVCLVLALALCNTAIAGSGSTTLTNSSACTLLLPASGAKAAAAWVSNTAYTVGTYVEINDRIYVCVVGGTSTSAAKTSLAGASGLVIDGSVTWRAALSKARRGLIVSNTSTNLYLYVNDTGVASNGVYLKPEGSLGLDGDDVPPGPIWVNPSATNPYPVVTFMEW